MKKNNKYIHHILNELAGDISPDDQKELKVWLQTDMKNQQEYDLIARIVREGKQKEFPADPNVHDKWKTFMFPEDPLPKQNTFSLQWPTPTEWIKSLLQPRRLAYLALFIIMITASFLWYHHSINSIKSITTANHQHKEITLSDGTTVHLNSGTELFYPKTFMGATRQVKLTGEAFFDVAKSESQFIVQTSEGTVTVVGTRFNIWARNLQTRVVVEDGQIRLAANDHASSIILTKDLMSEISQNQPPSNPRSVNVEELLGWRSGKLVFNRTMLSELAGELERYYDIDITIENPKLETKTITAVFDRLPLKNVLYSICSTLDIQYKYENGMYTFYKELMPDDQ